MRPPSNKRENESELGTQREKVSVKNLKLNDHFWNSRKKNIQFDEEKPSAASTNIDEDEIKYRESSRRSR